MPASNPLRVMSNVCVGSSNFGFIGFSQKEGQGVSCPYGWCPFYPISSRLAIVYLSVVLTEQELRFLDHIRLEGIGGESGKGEVVAGHVVAPEKRPIE